MANSDASSSTACTVRVLVSFYLAATDDSSSARTSLIHKEKFNVLLSGDKHKHLSNFAKHLKTFTGLVEIAKSKGLGENRTFSVHHMHQQHENCTLKEAHRMVKAVSSYCNGTIENAKSRNGITNTTSGPQGTIAEKTVVSLSLLENGLERLNKNIDVLVCLTIQVENVHAVSHFKHPTCTLLEYARDFGNNMKGSLKQATKWSAYYFTYANSYYPVPAR